MLRPLMLSLLLTGAAQAALPDAPQPPAAVKTLAHEVLQQAIETNSTHAFGSTALAEILAARFHAAGFSPDDLTLLAPPEHPNKGNLVLRYKGQGKGKPILLILHLDVVEAKPEDWSVDPFKLVEKDGYYYGRGTQDMKSDVAAITTDLIRLKGEGFVPERDIIVAFTADEEAEGDANGVDWLLKNHRDLIDAEFSINPDAGGGVSTGDRRLYIGLETSEKVFLTFWLEVTNKGGHSSLPEADNAIYRLSSALGRIDKYGFPVKLNPTTKAWFAAMAKLEKGQLQQDMLAMAKPTLDAAAVKRLEKQPLYNAMLHTTCVATMIEGGHAENALPQRARAMIQCRTLPADDQATVQGLLAKAVNDPEVKISVFTPWAPGPESVASPKFLAKMQSVVDQSWPHVPVVPDMDAGASDSKFTRGAGIPSFGITGLFIDMDDVRAHGRDERIGVDSFYQNVEFDYHLLKAFSSEE
jgi:acetylornithine deacetylase/succinyl-diaminopimelate desuccinylase-like protein